MANSQLKNKQARKVLLKTWQRRTRRWPAPNPVSWWIRCHPNDGTTRPAPQIFSPGAARCGVRPDGLWVCFGDGGAWCDAIVVDPRVLSIFRARPAGGRLPHEMRWGATMLISSRDVITLVFFQNFGKCRWLPVTR